MASKTPAAKTFHCNPPCNRIFKTAALLAKHKRYAPRHTQAGQQPTNALPKNGSSGVWIASASEIHGTQGVRITAASGQAEEVSTRVRNPGGNTRIAAGQIKSVTPAESKKKETKEAKPWCALCNKSFVTEQALADHVRGSPKHNVEVVNEGKQQKGKQGQQSTTVAAQGKKAKPKKKKKAKKAKHVDTPLDRFFKSYATYPYDSSKPPEKSFHQLVQHFGWKRESKEQKEAWRVYQSALVEEVRLWFGDEDDLAAWHQLCRAVRIRNPPLRIHECEQAVRRTHVNIVDLIIWGRNGQPANKPVTIFNTVYELSEYTFRTEKIFPSAAVVRDDGARNIVLRHLLRTLLRL
ncbi:hypothetical protein SEUCBS139899_001607 [Sporothrix eucalyptigena]|uniref:C2H2-type domain-containing protein n=1 Tax=Sporothrix eucalyptigena TaxID=1812306 RepID=A0ABP0BMR0_9PEZI